MHLNPPNSLVLILALLLSLTPIMVTFATSTQDEEPTTYGTVTRYDVTEISQETTSNTQSIQTENSRISSTAYQPDRCDDSDGGNDRCSICLCINTGVFNVDIDVENMLFQALISTEIASTPYDIHLVPPLRPPIS